MASISSCGSCTAITRTLGAVAGRFCGGHPIAGRERQGLFLLEGPRAIEDALSRRAKLLFLCYPNNPTGAVAPLSFWQEAVAWAKQYDVILVNDHPYSEVTFDGYRSVSILEAEGAITVPANPRAIRPSASAFALLTTCRW